MRTTLSFLHVVSVTLCLLACGGCGQSPKVGQERYVPTAESARTTIERAFQAWQQGEPSGEISGTKPLIFVTDSHRQKGQTLDRFEILGEVPGATPRCYLIQLKLSNPDAEEKIRYAVVGIDPLWVFRHEDLEMLLHWEHPMPAPNPASASSEDKLGAAP